MKVAIVILNWNGKENTLDCLKSAGGLRTTNYSLQVILVDNGSTDGSLESFKDLRYKQSLAPYAKNYDLRIIGNKENLGFAGGNNVGIRIALKNGADYIMIVNNDTILDKNLIVQLIEAFNNYKNAGIISPKIYFAPGFEYHKERYKKNEAGKVFWYAGGIIDWDNVYASHRGVDEVDKGQYNKVLETDYASGACMMVKGEVFKRIGLFDKDYFLYWEDADFSQRAQRAGFKVLYAPPAHLWHKNAGASSVGGPLHDYYLVRNRFIFAAKYATPRTRLAVIRDAFRYLFFGRPWQRRAILDYYFGNLGKGSFKS